MEEVWNHSSEGVRPVVSLGESMIGSWKPLSVTF